MAGLDVNLVQKWHEHGARNKRDAMKIAMQVERALEDSKLHAPHLVYLFPPPITIPSVVKRGVLMPTFRYLVWLLR